MDIWYGIDVNVDGTIGGDETNGKNRKFTFIVIYFVSIAESINHSISRIHQHYNLPYFPDSSYFSYSSSKISKCKCNMHFDKLLISPPVPSLAPTNITPYYTICTT